MTRYLTEDATEPARRPTVDDASVTTLVPQAVGYVLDVAETWLSWDGTPTRSHGNTRTPHKCLRRVGDHLIDHLAEIECRLTGLPTITDRWHGRRITTDADWARFTETDLDEATSRLSRLAAWYEARTSTMDAALLDERPAAEVWTLREVIHHVAGVGYYADRIGRLA